MRYVGSYAGMQDPLDPLLCGTVCNDVLFPFR